MTTTINGQEHLTKKEAKEVLNLSMAYINNLVDRGEAEDAFVQIGKIGDGDRRGLRSVKHDGRVYIAKAELERYQTRQGTGTKRAANGARMWKVGPYDEAKIKEVVEMFGGKYTSGSSYDPAKHKAYRARKAAEEAEEAEPEE